MLYEEKSGNPAWLYDLFNFKAVDESTIAKKIFFLVSVHRPITFRRMTFQRNPT
jgi:hypothetical protein